MRALLAGCCIQKASAGAINFRGSGHLQEADLESLVAEEFRSALPTEEADLRELFTSLPKDVNGRISHETVRYALHRIFAQRHGWYIRGLDPRMTRFQQLDDNTKEWMPEVLQKKLEELAGEGADLHGLAAFVATIEELARREVRNRLKDMYEVEGVQSGSSSDGARAMHTYFMSFLLANNWTVNDSKDLVAKKKAFHQKYDGFDEVMKWEREVTHPGAFPEKVGFETVAQAADQIGRQFHTYNRGECGRLRSTLKDLESRRAGRVRLSVFYNKSLHSNWDFDENVMYLRGMGALDESDPQHPSVIIPNYVIARPNCLDATDLYAVCCENHCESLLAEVGRRVGAPMGMPEQIAEIVSSIPGPNGQPKAQISPALLDRLHEVAAQNGGKVPLHGRLFSQWLHHVFPLDCPYPLEANSMDPKNADEWLQATSGVSTASLEERQQLVDADACAVNWEGKIECAGESAELPWSDTEQLLSVHQEQKHVVAAEEEEHDRSGLKVLMWFVALPAALSLVMPPSGANTLVAHVSIRQRKVAAVLLLIVAAYFSSLLDGKVFLMGLVGCALISSIPSKAAAKTGFELPMTQQGKLV